MNSCFNYDDLGGIDFVRDYLTFIGVSVDASNNAKVSCSKPNMLPSIAYEKTYDEFFLYFQAPNDLGIQKYRFDPYQFLLMFPKKDFSYCGYPRMVRLIVYCFSLNPTVLKKAFRQNKKLKRKVVLKVKERVIISIFGAKRYNLSGVEGKVAKIGKKEMSEEEKGKLEEVKRKMEHFVHLAASSFDLNFFEQYLPLAIQSYKLQHIHIPSVHSIQVDFKKQVEKLQS